MGLLWKDLWCVRSGLVGMTVFAVVFITIFRDQSLMFMIAPIFFSTIVGSSLSLDDMCRWDLFAVSSGIERRDLVRSKYLTGLVSSLIGLVIGLALMILFDTVDGGIDYGLTLQMLVTGLLLALVICGVTTAVYYITGDGTKGQYLSIVVTICAIMGLVSASAVVAEVLGNVVPVMGISAVLCLIVVVTTYRISCSRYETRDL